MYIRKMKKPLGHKRLYSFWKHWSGRDLSASGGGFECARGAQASFYGGLLYPPLAGSDSGSSLSNHFRPCPDLRNFSLNLAEL
jgi:hypothetical protein